MRSTLSVSFPGIRARTGDSTEDSEVRTPPLQLTTMHLSRDAITNAALELCQTYGLADVSMRRIASSLGVAPGALYWHVENKQELIGAMAQRIVAPVIDAPPGDPAALSEALRSAILNVRDGAEVVIAAFGLSDAPVGSALEGVFVEVVGRASISKGPRVRAAARGLLHLTLGATAVEQTRTQLAAATGAPSAVSEHDPAFDEAVRFMLIGLENG